jgi:hypothetical protein
MATPPNHLHSSHGNQAVYQHTPALHNVTGPSHLPGSETIETRLPKLLYPFRTYFKDHNTEAAEGHEKKVQLLCGMFASLNSMRLFSHLNYILLSLDS